MVRLIQCAYLPCEQSVIDWAELWKWVRLSHWIIWSNHCSAALAGRALLCVYLSVAGVWTVYVFCHWMSPWYGVQLDSLGFVPSLAIRTIYTANVLFIPIWHLVPVARRGLCRMVGRPVLSCFYSSNVSSAELYVAYGIVKYLLRCLQWFVNSESFIVLVYSLW